MLILGTSARHLTLQAIFDVSADLILIERVILPIYPPIILLFLIPDVELCLHVRLFLELLPPFREHKFDYLLELIVIVLL